MEEEIRNAAQDDVALSGGDGTWSGDASAGARALDLLWIMIGDNAVNFSNVYDKK